MDSEQPAHVLRVRLNPAQDGSEREDEFWAVAGSSNNTVIFAGHTEGSWRRSNLFYRKGVDFAALKTTAFFSGAPPADDGSPLPPTGVLIAAVVGTSVFVSTMMCRRCKKGDATHLEALPSTGDDLGPNCCAPLENERPPRVHEGVPVASEVGGPTTRKWTVATVEVVEQRTVSVSSSRRDYSPQV